MPVHEDLDVASAPLAKRIEVLELYSEIKAAKARLAGPDGETRQLPPDLQSFLGQLLEDLKAGKSVTILESDAAMTTVAAARMLSVSRQFLVQLLEHGEIPFHKVGTHRRVYVRDLLAYKSKRDVDRRRILDELVRKEYEEGLYDLIPVNALERD